MLKEKYYSKKKKKMPKAQVILNAGEYQFVSWSAVVVYLLLKWKYIIIIIHLLLH